MKYSTVVEDHFQNVIKKSWTWQRLTEEERRAFSEASCANNDRIRKRCDNAVNAVINFQKEHDFIDNR